MLHCPPFALQYLFEALSRSECVQVKGFLLPRWGGGR
jgi:hypothetical protein